jgi:hypothetical protein
LTTAVPIAFDSLNRLPKTRCSHVWRSFPSKGSLVYLVSSHDGARGVYAVGIERLSVRSVGDAYAVRHFHLFLNAWAGTTAVLSTGPASGVRGGRFVYHLATFSANVWLMTQTTPAKAAR